MTGSHVRRGGWWLPLILSFLPVAFLAYQADLQARLDREDTERRYLERTDPAARLLRAGSAPGFPALFLASRLKKTWEEIDQPDRPLAARVASLSKRLAAHLPPPSGAIQVWAVVAPDHGTDASPVPLAGPRWPTAQRTMMTRLLTDLLRQSESETGGPMMDKSWESRLRGLFGFGFLPAMLQAPYEGIPLPVIHKQKYGQVVWQICRCEGRPLGAFLVLLTPPAGEWHLAGLRFLADRWRPRHVLPAFLPAPIAHGPASGTPIGPPVVRSPRVAAVLQAWYRQYGIGPSPTPGDVRGLPRLPWNGVDRLAERGDWWVRVCPLDPATGHLGVLLIRRPATGPGLLGWTARLASWVWVIAWTWIGGFRLREGRWPQPGIRGALFLWFAGLAALPVMAAIIAGTRHAQAHERNLQDELARTLGLRLDAFEEEIDGLAARQAAICRPLLNQTDRQGRTLADRLAAAPWTTASSSPVLDTLLHQVRAAGLDALAVVAFGPQGTTLMAGHLRVPTNTVPTLLGLLGRYWANDLRPNASAVAPASVPQRLFSLGSMIGGYGKNAAGNLERFWLGRLRYMGVGQPFWEAGRLRMVIGIIWDIAPTLRAMLQTTFRSGTDRLSRPLTGLAVFEQRGLGLEYLAGAGDTTDLRALAAAVRPGRPPARVLSHGRSLGLARVLADHPSFILAAQAPLAEIQARLRQERRELAALVAGLLLLLGLVGHRLATWLARPMVRMGQGLGAIADGDLTVRLAEAREDELGRMTLILDQMTAELRTRRDLTRFVAPQVLDVVAGGSLTAAAAGRRQPVTVLASDLRDFTTISETHPPEAVFQMLNAHLAAMAEAIQSQGGVVDRFIGDAIVAVFYGPDATARERRALAAARAMRQAHLALQAGRARAGAFLYEIGIGLDSGEVVAGVLGDGEVRLDFTVLGEVVPLAAALESCSRQGTATRIVVSDAIRQRHPEEEFLPVADHAWELRHLTPPLPRPALAPSDSCPALHLAVPPRSIANADSPRPPARIPDPGGDPSLSAPSIPLVSPSPARSPTHAPSLASAHPADAPTARPSAAAAGVLVIWLLTGLCLGGGWLRWQKARQDRDRQVVESLLEADLEEVARLADPELAPTIRLQRAFPLLLPAVPPAPTSHDRGGIPPPLARRLTAAHRQIPGLSWAYASFHIAADPALATVSPVILGTDPTALASLPSSPSEACWEGLDIGGAHPPGQLITLPGGGWQVMGGGFDIDATWDDFFFAFRSDRFPGITARFTLPTDPTGAPRGQVGLMVRQGLTGDAACVALMARRGEILTARRAEEAAAMRPEGVPPPDRVRTASPEIWLRLLPGPDRLFGYGSVDGLEWHELGSWPFELSTDPAWGIALCANHAPFRGPLASWTTLVLGGAPLPAAARTDLRLFLPTLWVNLVTRLGFEIPIPSDLQRWVERRGGPFTGLYSQTIDHLRRRLMTAYDSPMNDVPRRWFITPILEEPDLLHPDDPIYRRASRSAGTLRYDPRREMAGRDIMRRLRGLLVLMVPPDQAPKALTMTQILRQWARRGALGVWSPTPPSPGQQVTNQFPRQAVTGGGPPRPWNTGLLAVATASELIFHRIPPGTLASESVWLARPKPPPTIPRVIGGLAALAWLAGGLWFLRYWRSGPERTFLPLSRQLLGGFLLAIFPTLVIAIAILDQSRAEHLTRQEGDSQETLFVRAAALEAATDLTRATTRALFRATFHPCVFASGVPQAGSEATNRLAETLPTLWRHLTLLGLPLLDLSVAPTQGQGAMFDPTRPVPATKDPRLLATRYLARTGARSLGWGEDQEPSSRPGAPDQEMLIGSELEKEYEDVGLTLGLDQVGRFFLAPDQLSTWSSSQGTNDHTYTTLIPGASRPPLGVMLTWRTMPEFHSFYYHLLQPRYDAPVRWSLIKSNAPAFRKARPVDSLRADPGQPFLTHEWLRLTPPADHRLALTAQRRRTAVLEERGHGSTRTLALAIPLRQLNDNIVIGTLRLGRILERVNREFLLQGALLVGILVLTIWLATLVTDRFLTPMHRLAAAAQRIAAGDYSPRLPLGDGGEFDALATAFNRMAEEAAQGRLLGRFVSEATLTTLREGRSAEARAGQSREAFVLFVTLTGFKDLLAERDPQSIVSLLNRALAAAGRHIRAAGGDIDKFIGDKLLAFFPITGTTPPAATLAQALHAAATLRQRLPVEIPDLPGPPALGLTRGPVLFGLLGTPSVRLEMTILGDTVNLASRLADLAARSGGGLVTDGAVADLVAATPDLAAAFPGRRLAETRVKGKRREVEIFRFDTA